MYILNMYILNLYALNSRADAAAVVERGMWIGLNLHFQR